MLLAIGNHEGGYLLEDREEFPFYFAYFPFQYGLERKDKLDRSSYHLHRFGEETLFLSLDSAHLVNPKSQEDFIKESVKEFENYNHRIAFFHVPMWSGTESDPVADLRDRLREVWKPLFESLNFDVVFQHHDHIYGRTKKLLGSEEFPYTSDEGIVYVNSGCMGVNPIDNVKDSSRYLKVMSKRHLLKIEVRKNEIKIKALDQEGEVFDEYTVHSDHP